MVINELYGLLLDMVGNNLTGTLTYEGIGIKWEYDSFNKDYEFDETELEHLHRVCEEDLEIIKEYLDEDIHHVSDSTIEDTYISFYVEE